MKNTLLCALFVGVLFTANAQSGKNVEKGLFKLNALLPGASYELGVGKNTTFNFDFSLIPVPIVDERTFGDDRLLFEVFPSLGADFRYFVNMQRRTKKGKETSRNTGNYVAFENQLIIATPILGNLEYDSPLGYLTGIVYGIQRTYGKGFYWGLSFGPKFFAVDEDVSGAISVNAKLGWAIGTRK